MFTLGSRLAFLLALVAADAAAVQSVVLPAWVCAHPDAIYVGGFESGQIAVPHNPSNGSGGAYPGSRSRTLHISGLGSGTQTYYLYLPSDYTPKHSWPLILALEGVAPYPGASYAMTVRDTWAQIAATGHFIVAAPVADEVIDVYGQPGVSWLMPPTFGPNDYTLFAAVLADLEGDYNIERTRLYGWGFSSGGHVMHALGVDKYSSVFNASTMAAYSVSAGALAGKVVVITGATRGCGRAMVDRFIEAGHTIIGCGRSEQHVAELGKQFGGPHRFDVVDVADDDQAGEPQRGAVP